MSRGIYRLGELNKSLDVGELAEFLERVKDDALTVVVFGSAARGRYVRGLSDVDVLVVTRGEPRQRALTRGLALGDVNVIYMSREEFCDALRRGNQVALEALTHGVTVHGAEPRELCG